MSRGYSDRDRDRDRGGGARVFVGNLPEDASRSELEKEFGHYGHLRDVWIARNPPGFGFIVFEDERDAEDAVDGLDGRTVCGQKARVEIARGGRRGGRGGGRGYGGRGGGGGFRDKSNEKCYNCGERGHFARDCSSGGGGGGGGGRSYDRGGDRYGGRSYSRRSYSRSRSRSPKRSSYRQSRSRSFSPKD